jgi:hypothetical protein
MTTSNKENIPNNFLDEILEDIGEMPISSTQKIRVLKVKDSYTGKTRLSVQKWWRPDSDQEWLAGKGFKLDTLESKVLAELITKGSEII